MRFLTLWLLLLLPIAILGAWPFMRERPDFSALDARELSVPIRPLEVGSPPGWSLHGAWDLDALDPRLAGLSGLDCKNAGRLDVVTDTGSLLRLAMPSSGTRAVDVRIAAISGAWDAEAVVRLNGHILVADEHENAVILSRRPAPHRIDLPRTDEYENFGIEALLTGANDESVVAFRESGRLAYRFTLDGDVETLRVSGARGRVTGAARLPDGRALVLQRWVNLAGFHSAVAMAKVGEDEVRIGAALALPTGPRANVEGLCAEPRGDGSTRLWIVTDDNGLAFLANRIVAWNVPAEGWPEAP